MACKKVKVKLKESVTSKDFWRATYNTDTNLGIRLVQNFNKMKENYLEGKLSQRGSLEVAIPVSYYNRERETIDEDIIEYGYVKEMKNIWEIVE
ncbi:MULTISPECIES: hypothetical protein [Clostridium]|jgi:hypothetical protein|uniref:hypothetical protein n=1 Tax=Clostridium TaxID=1485 RepID=UPI000288F76F|nr:MULTISPECIES: hypothetical protein [Clostridium]MDF2504549.1 hypothetical protein [Clostridium sp.]